VPEIEPYRRRHSPRLFYAGHERGRTLTVEVEGLQYETKAEQIAYDLIQKYIPDHKVIEVRSFFGVLVQHLEQAYAESWNDRARTETQT
jgi:hypothetical protein